MSARGMAAARRAGAVLVLGFVLVCITGCSRDADLARLRTFDEANRAYVQGDAERAAALYESILRDGFESGAVFYNLGNAYRAAERRGEAIAAWRQALRYRPGDPWLRANLEASLGRAPDARRSILDHLFFWHRWVGWPGRWRLFAAAATLAFVLGVAARLRRRVRGPARAAFALALLLGAGAVWSQARYAWTGHGVVAAADVVARKGDAESFEPAFTDPLPEGTEFTVLERRREWLLVRLHTATTPEAWLPASSTVVY